MTQGDERGLLPLAGVIGWPVTHSLSPLMMGAWLDAADLAGRYVGFAVAPKRLSAALRALPNLSISGVNVTVPHKAEALAIADEASPAARAMGAANLITVQCDGALRADNTDHVGIRAALRELGVSAVSGPVVLVGAGGAARAALHVLKAAGLTDLRLINRTTDRANTLLETFELEGRVFALGHAREALEGAGVIIQSSVMGMAGQPVFAPDLSGLANDARVFDMVYAPLQTPLLAAARQAGLRTADGLSMLIGQARPSFEAFFGAPPPDIDVRARLLAALEARS